MKKALALILSLALAGSALPDCSSCSPLPRLRRRSIFFRSRQHIWFRPGIRRALRRKDGGHRLAHVCRG